MMSEVEGASTLTEEQRQRIERNRRLALQRLGCGGRPVSPASVAAVTAADVQTVADALTPEQLARTEQNRLRAQQIRLDREAAALAPPPPPPPPPVRRPAADIRACYVDAPSLAVSPAAAANGPSSALTAARSAVVSLSLATIDRFEAKVEPFSEPVNGLFRTISSRNFNGERRRWTFALRDYEQLVETLRKSGSVSSVAALPDFVLWAARRPAIAHASPTEAAVVFGRIDAALVGKLFDYQREGVLFAVARHGRVLLADEMGLGKTIQALAVAAFYRDDWPLLVVCPAGVRANWRLEILKHLPSVSPEDVHVVTSGKTKILYNRKTVFITSYTMMSQRLEEFQNMLKPQFVILDESQNVKEASANQTLAAKRLCEGAKRKVLLSGTPILSKPAELHTQVAMLDKALLGRFRSFGERYCEGVEQTIRGRVVFKADGASNVDELMALLEHTVLIRRMKSDVLSDIVLPTKERVLFFLKKSQIKLTLDNLASARQRLLQDARSQRHAHLMEFYTESALAKADAAVSHVTARLDESPAERKFVVFFHHQSLLSSLATELARKGVKYVEIHGRVAAERRDRAVVKFQTLPEFRVALLGLTAANVGINLTAADTVIFAELFWNPGVFLQAEDRVHRIGQSKPVRVEYLVAIGTVDDTIWPMLQKKLGILQSVGLGSENFANATRTRVEDTPEDLARVAEQAAQMERQRNILDFLETCSDEQPIDTDEPRPPSPKRSRSSAEGDDEAEQMYDI